MITVLAMTQEKNKSINEKNLASNAEVKVLWWLREAKQAGLVEDFFYESRCFVLADDQIVKWNKKLKTKVKPKEFTLKRKIEYTPDFEVIFTEKARGILFFEWGDECVKRPMFFGKHIYFEVKPSSHDFNNMERLVRDRIKWVYDKYNVNIAIVKPEKLFKRTFTPERYFLTDSGKKWRTKLKNGSTVPIKDLDKTIKLKEFLNDE